jgi:hypothetical protein
MATLTINPKELPDTTAAGGPFPPRGAERRSGEMLACRAQPARSNGWVRHVGPPSPFSEISDPS